MTPEERAEEAALVRSWRGPMVTGELHHPDEARALVDLIRAGQRPAWVYVTALYDWRAHEALGYARWADMVHAELNVSVKHADRLVRQGQEIHRRNGPDPANWVDRETRRAIAIYIQRRASWECEARAAEGEERLARESYERARERLEAAEKRRSVAVDSRHWIRTYGSRWASELPYYRDLADKAWGPVRSTVSEEVLSTRSD